MEVEQFMRIHVLKAMTGALAATVMDLTPEAAQQAIAIGERRGLPRTRDVRVVRLPAETDAAVFDVTYIDGSRSIRLRESVRDIGGQWRIATVERI